MTQRIVKSACLGFLLSAVACSSTFDHARDGGVSIAQQDGKLSIQVGGKPFAEYHYQNVPRPFFYPVLSADGLTLTRHWPMADMPGEEHDHPHHRSLWFTHGDVNGHDFWAETPKSGTIVHDSFLEVRPGSREGSFKSRNRWVARDGKIICTDVRTMRVHNRAGNERLLDFEVRIEATHGDVTFGDTKEGSMAIRLAESMRVTQPKGHPPGQGHIVNSEGLRDTAAWGKRARWCDYSGPVQGKTVGVAIFDHPSNPKHPTWWHVRDYGLFAANPFGVHDFEKAPPGTGNLTIPAGKSATFRYRFYFHAGDTAQANVEQRYQEYVAEKVKG